MKIEITDNGNKTVITLEEQPDGLTKANIKFNPTNIDSPDITAKLGLWIIQNLCEKE